MKSLMQFITKYSSPQVCLKHLGKVDNYPLALGI